jgi:hypothetical protein
MSAGTGPTLPNRRQIMSQFFKSSDTFRSLIGMVAAVVIGGTFLLAAAGPAVASEVNVPAVSNIVRG